MDMFFEGCDMGYTGNGDVLVQETSYRWGFIANGGVSQMIIGWIPLKITS